MNEFYGADPESCESPHALRYLLNLFGPYAGRYLAAYPDDWVESLRRFIEPWSEMDRKRATSVLQRAIERGAIVQNKSLPWDKQRGWLENALMLLEHRPPRMEAVITSPALVPSGDSRVFTLEEFQPPPTSEERIVACEGEFSRVSRTLLVVSDEVAIVDPYLDPGNKFIFPVVKELLETVSKGKCIRVTLWARYSALFNYKAPKQSNSKLMVALRKAASEAMLPPQVTLRLLLVDDERSNNRMHQRFLLSRRGCISFDQGFQISRRKRRTAVAPVGEATHADYVKIFLDKQNDFSIVKTIGLPPNSRTLP